MNGFLEKNKKRIIDYLVLLAFSIFTYSELMVNQLVNNYDGLWEGSFHIADAWELSIGRWFWFYLSKLRFGVAADPVISIISLALFVLGMMFLFDLMEVKERVVIYASGAAFICTPLVCIDLSYRFMSSVFATSFLLAVLSVWVSLKIRKMWIAVPVAGFILSLSLGSYQAYIGVACVVTLAYFIKLLLGDEPLPACLKRIASPILSILLGGILYIVFLNLHLRIKHVEMVDYMGASEISLKSVLGNFRNSFLGVYQIFAVALRQALFNFNRLQKFHICAVLIVLFTVAMTFFFLKGGRKKTVRLLCAYLTLLLMPAAAFSVKFITVQAPVSLQMTAGFFMLLPALLCTLPLSFEKSVIDKVIAAVAVVFTVAFAYGGFYQVQADQSAMYEGRQSVLSISDMIIDRVTDMGYLDTDYSFCFVGNPVGSELYYIDEATYGANVYALFGVFESGYNGLKSWEGVIRYMKGLNLPFVTGEQYYDIVSKEEVSNMPAFPEEGSIILTDDVVVIKASRY